MRRLELFARATNENFSTTGLSVLEQSGPSLPVPRSLDEDLQVLKSQVQKPIGPRTQVRHQALELLKKLYLPQPSQADIRESALWSWLPIVCELEGESHALDHSLLTLCVIQVAITKMGSAGVEEALQVYNNALQNLLTEIEHDGAGQSDEILAAISVLSTCEVFLSSKLFLYTTLTELDIRLPDRSCLARSCSGHIRNFAYSKWHGLSHANLAELLLTNSSRPRTSSRPFKVSMLTKYIANGRSFKASC